MAADRSWTTSVRSTLGSVRARTTIAAVLVGGVAAVGASLLLVSLLEKALERNITDAARLRAHIVAATLEAGTSPRALVLPDEDDLFIQVVDENREEVLAVTRNLEGLAPHPESDPRYRSETIVDEEHFLTVEETAHTADEDLHVVVGQSIQPVRESTAIARRLLALALPVLLVAVALTTWLIVGRALAPVEAIRKEVTEISAAELHRRVSGPSGDDEISRLARTMNEMLARLEDSRTKQEHLVSDAAHELRNPIAAIRNYAEVALAHPERATVGGLAEDVLKEDLRLQHLAEDLLLLARADEKRLQLSSVALDLDDIVLEEAQRLKATGRVQVDTSEIAAARTVGDAAQLQRAVRNLTDNAARHARTTVRLALRETDSRVVLEVDDDGTGIAQESRSAVFERFTRLDDARDRERGGAGLGLAIVATIVAAHGGSVSVGDAPLGGARFEVVLPRASA